MNNNSIFLIRSVSNGDYLCRINKMDETDRSSGIITQYGAPAFTDNPQEAKHFDTSLEALNWMLKLKSGIFKDNIRDDDYETVLFNIEQGEYIESVIWDTTMESCI